MSENGAAARRGTARPLIPLRSTGPDERGPNEQGQDERTGGPSPEAGGAISYRVHHLTRYTYDKPVSRNVGRAHVEPRATPFQRVLSHEVSVSPSPSVLATHTDFSGNSATYLLVEEPHEVLEVHSRAEVSVLPRAYALESISRSWSLCTADHWGPLMPADSVDFLLDSPRVRVTPDVRDYAASIFTPDRPIGDSLSELCHRIHEDFTYDAGATTVASTLEEVMRERRGVCQDYAHVGVAVCRSMGLAARYVSGYLRTARQKLEPPGSESSEELIGSAATHAWLSVLVPGSGWVDVDPTNDTFVDTRFVTTAWGRDYGDVPPLKGIVVGPSGNSSHLEVKVAVAPIDLPEPTPGR